MKEQLRATKRCIPGVILVPKNGYWQIKHIGLSAERVKKDPAFQRTRQQAKEFGRDTRLAKLICDAWLPGTGIKKALSRLRSLIIKARQADTHNPPGYRTLVRGDHSLLVGFDFNQDTPLSTVMDIPFIIRKMPGQCIRMEIPPFIPARCIHPPPAMKHCRIYITVCTVDINNYTVLTDKRCTTVIPVKNMEITLKPINIQVPAPQNNLVIVGVGIQWYKAGLGSPALLPGTVASSLKITDIGMG